MGKCLKYRIFIPFQWLRLGSWDGFLRTIESKESAKTALLEAQPKKCDYQGKNKFKMEMVRERIHTLESRRSEDCKNGEFYLSLGITAMIEKLSNSEQWGCLEGIDADNNHLFELYDGGSTYKRAMNTCLQHYEGLISQ